MQLHAVYGMDQDWTVLEIKQWLNRHNLQNIKPPRKEGHQIRFRIRPPAYKTYITKKVMTHVKKPYYSDKSQNHKNSLTPENRLIYMVFGIGEPDEKYNKHLHDRADQNEKP